MLNRFLALITPPTSQRQQAANYPHDIQELLEDKNTILDTIISKTTEYPLLQAECIKAQKSILNHTRRIEAINISALNQQNNQQILKRNVNVQEMFKSVEREANRSVVGTLIVSVFKSHHSYSSHDRVCIHRWNPFSKIRK